LLRQRHNATLELLIALFVLIWPSEQFELRTLGYSEIRLLEQVLHIQEMLEMS